uniref:Magnetosome protein MamS/MamX domain-containing protein n=1 Tax=Magnetospirillum gryphiswaldense TaxID=55518 RepID=Q93DY5_9PROT|nr:unknown [Magnetospirillum gryphiswaldense MSR-1]
MDFRPDQVVARIRGAVEGALTAQSVLGIGGALVLILVVIALLPDRFTRGEGKTATAVSSGAAQALPAALPGLSPFTPAKPLQFSGRVTQVASIGNDVGWGQVHVWIDNGTGALQEISVAPQSYLNQIGCPSFSGIGFLFDAGRPNAELYAKSVLVGGRTCKLRDDEGLALWMTVQ